MWDYIIPTNKLTSFKVYSRDAYDKHNSEYVGQRVYINDKWQWAGRRRGSERFSRTRP
jgi:hypothetical protein